MRMIVKFGRVLAEVHDRRGLERDTRPPYLPATLRTVRYTPVRLQSQSTRLEQALDRMCPLSGVIPHPAEFRKEPTLFRFFLLLRRLHFSIASGSQLPDFYTFRLLTGVRSFAASVS